MTNTISIKELRMNLADIADRVQNGEVFTVMRRSKPSFLLVQASLTDEVGWETIVDFTNKGETEGEPIEAVIAALKSMSQ